MADDMRIALIGQAAFGESVLNALVEGGSTIDAVFCPPDKDGRPPDPIKAAALEHGIKVLQFGRLRDQEAIDAFKALNVDLCVMAFVTDIVPEAIIEAPPKKTINFHPSLLPEHRGPSSINWPIIQGKTKTGLTIFWPDAGLDTGPILLQKEVDIGPDDTLGIVYFDKIFPLGVQAMIEAVDLVRKGTAPRIEQDESKATYESWCRAKHVIIQWDKPVDEVYNLIRGAEPSPGAGTTFGQQGIQFYKASKQQGSSGKAPGEVTEVTQEGFGVAAKDGIVFIRRVQPEDAKKLPAPEWIESVALKPGAKFGGA